ncbi:MAG: helix-turn-helix domain-containing protein [Thermoanaerobaculia bacterium]|nr:helix-turn-helix domain-containing protein [Thermoanaerobaculia bacterium]
MGRIICWTLENNAPALQPHETNCLLFADNVVRYLKFETTFSVRLCLTNSVTYLAGNQRIDMLPGSYFAMNEGVEMECLPTLPHTKAAVVFFTKALLGDVNRTLGNDEKMLLDDPAGGTPRLHFLEHLHRQPSKLSTQLQSIAHQMAASGRDDQSCPDHLFYTLAENLVRFDRQTRQQIDGIKARSASTKQELYRRVLAARAFMFDQWEDPLSLDEVARYACLSPYHFHRSFREAFGESPMRWFKKLKLERARALLATESVSATALRCGFADVFSFSKAFKRAWGVAPSVFAGHNPAGPGYDSF